MYEPYKVASASPLLEDGGALVFILHELNNEDDLLYENICRSEAKL